MASYKWRLPYFVGTSYLFMEWVPRPMLKWNYVNAMGLISALEGLFRRR